MNWSHFFEAWAWVSGASTFFSFFVVAFAIDEKNSDKRFWLIPSVLAFLTAISGSLAAGLVK